MKKIIVAVALVAGMLGASVVAADAYPHHGGYGHHRHCTGWGWRHHHHDRYCRGWGM